jgi:hemerythrin-like domain-containing protein
MSLVQIDTVDTENTVEQLVEVAESLPNDKLDTLMERLRKISAERRQPHLSKEETELFQIINRGLPREAQQRYVALRENLEDETMTQEEQTEFLALTAEIEKLDAERLKALVTLAKVRGTTLDTLMDSLGIKSPTTR